VSGTETIQVTPTRAGASRGVEAFAPPAYGGRQYQLLAVVVVLGCLPSLFASSAYYLGLLNNALVYAILTLGFYWCFVLAGQFTFALFGMYAVGSYASVWFSGHLGSFWWGLLAAIVVAGMIGALTKLAFARCSEIYFAIATMALGSLIVILFREWTSLTGGFGGIGDLVVPSVFGYILDTPEKRYFLGLVVLGVFLLLTVLYFRSPVAGDLALARDKAAVASVTGLKPLHLQVGAFAVGSAMQGAAGSLYAHNAGYFSVEAFNIDLSLLVLLMLLLGGMRSMYGPVIGAVLLVYLPEVLRDAEKYAEVIYAAAILFVIVAFPGGIAGFRHTVTGWVQHARRT